MLILYILVQLLFDTFAVSQRDQALKVIQLYISYDFAPPGLEPRIMIFRPQ